MVENNLLEFFLLTSRNIFLEKSSPVLLDDFQIDRLNIMGLGSPLTAILSAVIYNALVIVALIPLALKGVSYQEKPASQILRHNLLIYGLGGIIAPFIFIKIIDLILSMIIL